jgi:hypothetical protein
MQELHAAQAARLAALEAQRNEAGPADVRQASAGGAPSR